MSAHKHAQETPWNTSYVNASVLKKKKNMIIMVNKKTNLKGVLVNLILLPLCVRDGPGGLEVGV